MDGSSQRWWSAGELARVAGITVRALRHYEQLGLLVAGGRSSGGHRRYTEADVARLFHVLALRTLGLALNEIAGLLHNGGSSELLEAARAQRKHVEDQLNHLLQLRDRLDAVIHNIGAKTETPTDQILEALETMAMTVHLTRIYTRRGDDGHTDLAGNNRVGKLDPRVEAIGAVDELNAVLGLTLSAAGLTQDHVGWLQQIQNDLFDVGADLARQTPAPTNEPATSAQVEQRYVTWLEGRCDEANAELPALRSFVVPGGTSAAAHLHLARTVCRRAERRVLAVPDLDAVIVRYLNRLSDLLFILSRVANRNADEPLWRPGQRPA